MNRNHGPKFLQTIDIGIARISDLSCHLEHTNHTVVLLSNHQSMDAVSQCILDRVAVKADTPAVLVSIFLACLYSFT